MLEGAKPQIASLSLLIGRSATCGIVCAHRVCKTRKKPRNDRQLHRQHDWLDCLTLCFQHDTYCVRKILEGSGMRGFREFLLRGNVVDLAVAVVIGVAFAA